VILRFGLATEGAGNRLHCIRGDVAGVEKRSAGQPVTIDEEARGSVCAWLVPWISKTRPYVVLARTQAINSRTQDRFSVLHRTSSVFCLSLWHLNEAKVFMAASLPDVRHARTLLAVPSHDPAKLPHTTR